MSTTRPALEQGIAVDADLRRRWRTWLAPDVQPFFVESLRPWPKSQGRTGPLSMEHGHTYRTWKVHRRLETLWLDESTFLELSRPQRAALVRCQVVHGRGAVPTVRRWSDVLDPTALRSQADGHRFVWWPSLVAGDPRTVLSRVISAAPHGGEAPAPPSRHDEVTRATWARCSTVLPEARHVAGSFPTASGPNCFATVMAAAGVSGAEHDYVLVDPFLIWLESSCRRGGRDADAGTVLVWRDGGGTPVHAAVTIGDGWALEKASSEWWTPRAVRTVSEVIRGSRARGQRLERHHVVASEGR